MRTSDHARMALDEAAGFLGEARRRIDARDFIGAEGMVRAAIATLDLEDAFVDLTRIHRDEIRREAREGV